jgi:endoglucanase
MKRRILIMMFLCIPALVLGRDLPVVADTVSKDIRLNQLGFYPDAPKIAIITAQGFSDFTVASSDKKETVFTGNLKVSAEPALNGKKTLIADFTSLTKPGGYIITVKGLGNSFPFVIGNSVYHQLANASIKAYYYQRASTALPEKFAGKWHRAAGHPDNKVFIHPSAATEKRPAGTIISAPGGWYDAGDFNKYIVNSGITMGTLLSLCEDFPDHIKTQDLNIPESGNKIPDVLNEIIYNLRWMLAMQDPNDGGVYNKLTNADFDGMGMPDASKSPRYVVQKGTAATLDFAAVTAKASRILTKYQRALPGLADSCLKASVKAWEWAQANPNMAYDQNKMNARFTPQITTGGYGDRSFGDEFIWAAAELYIATGNQSYYEAVNMFPDDLMPVPSWANVRLMGYYALLSNQNRLSAKAGADLSMLKARMVKLADDLISGVDDRAYQTVMGKSNRDFGWGSNSLAANQGMVLIKAYLLTRDNKYLNYALSNLDYLLGRNATGYSYVTGIGYKTPMHPHHRQSVADGIVDPVPGLLVGGPNPGMQDGIKVPSTVPDEAYIDDFRAYAANEIAINWNAPLVYLVNALEALETVPK